MSPAAFLWRDQKAFPGRSGRGAGILPMVRACLDWMATSFGDIHQKGEDLPSGAKLGIGLAIVPSAALYLVASTGAVAAIWLYKKDLRKFVGTGH
jgi:hypothetical protein